MHYRRQIALMPGVFFLVLTLASFVWAGSQQTTVLAVISCPVYQAPSTPDPGWPTACGGQRVVPASAVTVNLAAFAPSVLFAILGFACLGYGITSNPGSAHDKRRR